MKFWAGEVKSIALALGLVLVVRTVVAEPYTVPSPSMVPTLLVGDELIGSKFAYGYGKYSSPIGLMPDFAGRLFDRAPERGDVVVFRLPRDPSQTYVKRLIGLPGDRVQMREGRLYINDKLVPRRKAGTYEGDTVYVESLPASGGGTRDHEILEVSDSQAHDDTPVFVVPPHYYFMMGDNRDDSLDSRIAAADGGVGFVPEENLVARADRLLLSRDTKVGWGDIGEWAHAFRLARFFGRID
ncbi:MAG TPA: signal peptidase I [Reyranella sp.]|nr:signal peptidase I [Reyranella sp.]